MSSRHRRARLAAALVGATIFGVTACSDGSSTTSTRSSSAAPEDVIAPAAQVASGLRELVTVADEVVAAGPDKARAKAAAEKLEPIWEHVEGAVRKNDLDVYVQIEEDLVLIEKAADAAKRGAADLTMQVQNYLARFPG